MTQGQTISHYQPLLHTIAYNLVRCKEDAEDIVQETFVRWLSIDHQKIENTKAYLIKAVTNNCFTHLSLRKRKKEENLDAVPVDEWFGDFKETHLAKLDRDVNLSAAFKVLQTKLGPLERAVYLLKEVFDFDYEELQQALNKKKEHCRQLFCRAQKKLSEETAKIHWELPDGAALINSFRKACDFGNASDFVQELKNDISKVLQEKF